MTIETEKSQRALLVSVYKGTEQKETAQEHLDELAFLVETFGAEIVAREICGIRKYTAATFITSGKLDELKELAAAHDANLIVFDDELTPAQQRNLEEEFKLPVVDRTGIILDVFANHARTKESRLQIEMAKQRYLFPRLKRMWTHLSRQAGGGGGGGGGGYLKGEGEKQIEIDRRLLKQRLSQLQQELDEVRASRLTQRSARQRNQVLTFALIGYTNVGKSTLLNALTEADVLVENKLFATLDTTTRKFTLPNNQDILLIDTVGFIRKLPHLLVESFKSTLEEAFTADFLLHVVDASHPSAIEQSKTTLAVLKELKAEDKEIITILNKMDECKDPSFLTKFRLLYPHTVPISAKTGEGFKELQEAMIEILSKQRQVVQLRIPQRDYAAVSQVMRDGNILQQEYEDNDVLLRVDLPNILADKLKQYHVE